MQQQEREVSVVVWCWCVDLQPGDHGLRL